MKKQIIRSIIIVAGMIFLGHYTQAASFVVNSTLDTRDAVPGDGLCEDAGGNCTLRAAIDEAQAKKGPDTITIIAKGRLTIGSAFPHITEPGLTIIGPGSNKFEILYVVSVHPMDPVFRLEKTNHISIAGIKITGVSNGGIIVNNSHSNTFDDIKIIGVGISSPQILMDFSASDSNTITNCLVTQGRIGFFIGAGSDHNIISRSTSTANQHSGITISDSDYNTATNNIITNIIDDFGMFLISGAAHNLVEGNVFTGNKLAAITVGGGRSITNGGGNTDNSIFNNTITHNGAVIVSEDESVSNLLIEDNTISDNIDNVIHFSNSTLPVGAVIRDWNYKIIGYSAFLLVFISVCVGFRMKLKSA